MPRSHNWPLPFMFSDKKFFSFPHLSIACHVPRPPHPHWFHQHNTYLTFAEASSLCSAPHIHVLSLTYQCSHQHPVLKHTQLVSMLVFWFVTPCELLGRYRRFGRTAMKVKTVCSSTTFVSVYKSTRCCNPEEQQWHLHRCESVTSHSQSVTVKDQVSHPCKTTGRLTVLCNLL
jgi:hypothetical protein